MKRTKKSTKKEQVKGWSGIAKKECRILREELNGVMLNDIMTAITERYGLAVEVGNMSYQHDEVSVKLNFRLLSAGNVLEADYDMFKALYGLPDLFQTVIINNEEMKIIGYKPKKRKYPVIVENQNGKRYKITHEQAIRCLKGSKRR
jgi:hypothetical protein